MNASCAVTSARLVPASSRVSAPARSAAIHSAASSALSGLKKDEL
ncbi:hypothetical protein [Allokutzneria sp. NRRL B-24872]|nr:hypothetical protein [Allokutzneria sp. NRRL B-24872]